MGQQVVTPFNNRAPELEQEFQRNSDLGYEAGGTVVQRSRFSSGRARRL